MSGGFVWLDGRVVPREQAVAPIADRGVRDGEGLFETLRVEGGEPLLWHDHLERLVVACAELGFPVPPAPATLRDGVAALLAHGAPADAVARITVTRGVPGRRPARGGCWIELEPLAGRLWHGLGRGGVRAVRSRRPFAPGPAGRYKTTSRIAWNLARDEARAAGAAEALLFRVDGELLEGAVSNVFVRVAGVWLTPPLDRDVLPGIVRRRVLALASAGGLAMREAPVSAGVLAQAEEIVLTNSVQEIAPVAVLDGRPLPSCAAGEALARAWHEALRPG